MYAINVGPGDNVLLGSATVDIAPGPPRIAAKGRPRVAGNARVGRTLRAVSQGWTVSRVEVRYRWFRDGRVVPGAHAKRYRLKRRDIGHRMKVRLTATKPNYVSGAKTSPRTKRVSARRNTAEAPQVLCRSYTGCGSRLRAA